MIRQTVKKQSTGSKNNLTFILSPRFVFWSRYIENCQISVGLDRFRFKSRYRHIKIWSRSRLTDIDRLELTAKEN